MEKKERKGSKGYDYIDLKDLTPEELKNKREVLVLKLQHQLAWSELPKDAQKEALAEIQLLLDYEEVKNLSWENEEFQEQAKVEFHEMFKDVK